MVHRLPVRAAVRQVLSLLKLRLLQGATHNGVAVTIHPVGEPRTRDADPLGVRPLHNSVISVWPRLHCFHRLSVSTDVLAKEL